jgi:hypothetical protein
MIKSKGMIWVGYVACIGDLISAHKVLVGKPEVKRPLGRPRRGWENVVSLDLEEILYEGVDWIPVIRDQCLAFVNTQ